MEDSKNEESQQDVDGTLYCIQVVYDDVVVETEVMLTDQEPEGEGDAIHVQCVQTVHEPNYWVSYNLYFVSNNMKLSLRKLLMGVLWSNLYPR